MRVKMSSRRVRSWRDSKEAEAQTLLADWVEVEAKVWERRVREW